MTQGKVCLGDMKHCHVCAVRTRTLPWEVPGVQVVKKALEFQLGREEMDLPQAVVFL